MRSKAWSGGTSTELFIFPPTSSYEQRDFDIRLSRATIDVAESKFTSLPGISRILMILSGSVYLTLDGKEKIKLHPFNQLAFAGGQEVIALGKCSDFNIMHKNAFDIQLNVFKSSGESPVHFPISSCVTWAMMYMVKGTLSWQEKKGEVFLEEGSLCVWQRPTIPLKIIDAKIGSEIIWIEFKEKTDL